MEPHPYGWLSLAPPIVAVVLAILTRRVLPALLAGLFVGAMITARGSLLEAVIDVCEIHLWSTLIQPDKLRVSAFTLLIGATIGVIQATGGMRGLVNRIAPLARTRRSGQIGAWFMGLVVFFDDYANCLLLGTTLSPICDRLRISREKLAYIVDSTAAPVAGIALVSTWIAVELDYIREGLRNLNPAEVAGLGAFDLFIACIPYRFYVIQTLILVFLIAWMRRDFGPMLAAERRACLEGNRESNPARDAESIASLPTAEDDATERTRAASASDWLLAAVPIGITLFVVLGLIYLTGKQKAISMAGPSEEILLRDIFGAGDSALALQYGGLLGLISAMLLARGYRLLPGARLWDAAARGAAMVLPALAILWFASAMSRMTSNKSYQDAPSAVAYEHHDHRLYTGDFLKTQLLRFQSEEGEAGGIARWLPTIIFLLASVISFCTGTSYGTMGILVPMVVPLAYAAIGATSGEMASHHPLFLASMGSVLAGAIFGDHCSPISDTTILSSQASGCDHMAHVNTQMPYALLGGGVSVLLGTVLIGFGVSVWLLLPLQTLAMIAFLWWFGRSPESDHPIESKT